MSDTKTALLKQHRRQKRIALFITLGVMLTLGASVHYLFIPVAGFLAWLAHEAWLSDHLFYPPSADQPYALSPDWQKNFPRDAHPITCTALPSADTLLISFKLRASMSGFLFDPWVEIAGQRFYFERGAQGLRHCALSPSSLAGKNEIHWRSAHCRVHEDFTIAGFLHQDYRQKRTLILAPHADDAELAAFGLYQGAEQLMLVTLTQGEIEAENYCRQFNLCPAAAARLKGRLRTWDSLAIPLWGNVQQTQCLQLGYYCMQLSAMRDAPDQAWGSRISHDTDTRPCRRWNALSLPGDAQGTPSWQMLVADLAEILRQFQPEVIILPHPSLDPHPDHQATTDALRESLTATSCQPEYFLYYANHLHNNDLWPMGPAGNGITLPPQFDPDFTCRPWLLPLSETQQIDKALALAMQHDLLDALPWKRRIRRQIQRLLAGRRWPYAGENEYFRKAVRAGELFLVSQSPLDNPHR